MLSSIRKVRIHTRLCVWVRDSSMRHPDQQEKGSSRVLTLLDLSAPDLSQARRFLQDVLFRIVALPPVMERLHSFSVYSLFVLIPSCQQLFAIWYGPMWATSPSLFQHGGLNTSEPAKAQAHSHICRIAKFHEGIWKP